MQAVLTYQIILITCMVSGRSIHSELHAGPTFYELPLSVIQFWLGYDNENLQEYNPSIFIFQVLTKYQHSPSNSRRRDSVVCTEPGCLPVASNQWSGAYRHLVEKLEGFCIV
jgi:hypothetical protein